MVVGDKSWQSPMEKQAEARARSVLAMGGGNTSTGSIALIK